LTQRPCPKGITSLFLAAVLALLALALAGGSNSGFGPSARVRMVLAFDPTGNGGTGFWEPGLAAARRYARRRPGDVSFAIVDLRSHLRGFRETRTVPAASTIKAMLLAAYLRQRSVRGRALRPDEKELLDPMIRSSDNAAGIQIAASVGGRVKRLARAARMRDFHWVWEPGWLGGLSQISARDQAAFLYRYPSYLPKRHRRYARRLLASIVPWQRWGIGSARPRGWRLYFKGGWGIDDDGIGTVNHQVAFLERGRCRISLAILTEHSTATGAETLRGVAQRLLHGIESAPCGRMGQAGASILGKSGGTRSTRWPPGLDPSSARAWESSASAARSRLLVRGR
jgi:beta-lactamase class A